DLAAAYALMQMVFEEQAAALRQSPVEICREQSLETRATLDLTAGFQRYATVRPAHDVVPCAPAAPFDKVAVDCFVSDPGDGLVQDALRVPLCAIHLIPPK